MHDSCARNLPTARYDFSADVFCLHDTLARTWWKRMHTGIVENKKITRLVAYDIYVY